MNTLRQIGEFVGITRGALEAARFGGVPEVRLTMISALVSGGARNTSMRSIMHRLENLTPVTLEAQIVGSRSGDEGFKPVIRVNPSGGITWFTSVHHDGGGIRSSYDISNAGGDFGHVTFSPGSHQLIVKRVGISDTGFVSLERNLGLINVFEHHGPPPPPPPPPKPHISVQSNGDGSFKVSGSGFVPSNAVVNILVGDGTLNQNPLNFPVTAVNGAFTDFPTGKICQRAGTIFFEASDGRISDGSQLFSNTVAIGCPF